MNQTFKTGIWNQFGATIDMLSDAIELCPDRLWSAEVLKDSDDTRYGQFWYIAYHALSWLDLYLDGSPNDFQPPAPFIAGGLPDEPYTKADVAAYLEACRQKCRSVIEGMSQEQANEIHAYPWIEADFVSLQIYSMRHVQEHAAQLSMILTQNGVQGLDWVPVAR